VCATKPNHPATMEEDMTLEIAALPGRYAECLLAERAST
jgi:hypothetical protein